MIIYAFIIAFIYLVTDNNITHLFSPRAAKIMCKLFFWKFDSRALNIIKIIPIEFYPIRKFCIILREPYVLDSSTEILEFKIVKQL